MIAQSRAPKCGQTKPPASRLERKTIKSTATCKAETLILKAPILTGRPSKMSDRQKIKPFSKTESAKYHPYPKIPNRFSGRYLMKFRTIRRDSAPHKIKEMSTCRIVSKTTKRILESTIKIPERRAGPQLLPQRVSLPRRAWGSSPPHKKFTAARAQITNQLRTGTATLRNKTNNSKTAISPKYLYRMWWIATLRSLLIKRKKKLLGKILCWTKIKNSSTKLPA